MRPVFSGVGGEESHTQSRAGADHDLGAAGGWGEFPVGGRKPGDLLGVVYRQSGNAIANRQKIVDDQGVHPGRFLQGFAVNGPFAVGHLAIVLLHRPGRADAHRSIFRAELFCRAAAMTSLIGSASPSICCDLKAHFRTDVDKLYFSIQTNAVAIAFGIAPEERWSSILEIIMNDSTMPVPFPYFNHFIFAAFAKAGEFEKYGFKQMDNWRKNLEEHPTSGKRAGNLEIIVTHGVEQRHISFPLVF